ncbi:hypothetical protein RMATCC62417_11367 [Rhizopus microsporus]|nr:hypothetical protein RMATCC62417_11367 [Rhizopus microsporus]
MSDHEDVDALFEDDPGPLEEVIDEDDAEDLKLDQAENKVWLVKVPRFLSEMWKKIDQENVRLGSVRIYKDSAQQGKSSVSLVLPDNETTATIPKEYSINFISTDVQNKFVFSQSDHGKAISGTVYHEGVAEILNEICILNKRGPYAGNYQLKPEFKQRLSAAEKQNAVEKSPEEATSSEDEEFMEDVKL